MSTRKLKPYTPDPIDALAIQMDQMRVLMMPVLDVAENPEKNLNQTGTLLYMINEMFEKMDKSWTAYMDQLCEDIEKRKAA